MFVSAGKWCVVNNGQKMRIKRKESTVSFKKRIGFPPIKLKISTFHSAPNYALRCVGRGFSPKSLQPKI